MLEVKFVDDPLPYVFVTYTLKNNIVSYSLSKFPKNFIDMTQKFWVDRFRPNSHLGNSFSSLAIYKRACWVILFHKMKNSRRSTLSLLDS